MIWHLIPEEVGHESNINCTCNPNIDSIDSGDIIVTHNIIFTTEEIIKEIFNG